MWFALPILGTRQTQSAPAIMFSSNAKTSKPGSSRPGDTRTASLENTLSVIAIGTTIDGNVYSEGDLRVEGRIIGTLSCKSRVVVGTQGKVEGNVDAYNATIAGTVQGTVFVRDMLQLQETGKIFGDIVTGKITIQPGGEFSGSCKMGTEAGELLKRTPQPALGSGKPVNLLGHNGNGSYETVTAEELN